MAKASSLRQRPGWDQAVQRQQGLATVVAAVGAGAGGYRTVDIGAGDAIPFAAGRWAATLAPRTTTHR